jgi:RHS repeat-associated protein
MVEHGLGAASTATTTYTVGAGNAGPRQLTSLSTTVDAATTKSSFTYDAAGGRLVRTDASGTTVYLPGGQEILINGSKVSATRYYSFAGRTVAVRSGTGMAGVSSLVCDPHGSVVASVPNTLWTATSVKRVFSDPFGAIRGGSDAGVPGDHRFLGAVRDTGSGLTLLGARYYDERVGQFISVDPLLDSGSPAQFNAYVYSGNNPVTWSDPSGMVWQGANWKSDAPATPTNSGVTSSSGGSSSATPPPSTSFAAYFECKDIWCQISWDANFNLQIVGGVAKGAWDLVCFSTGIPGLVDSFTELGEAVSDFDGYQAKKAAERDALWTYLTGGPETLFAPLVNAWNTNPGELIGEGAVTVATFAVPGGGLIKAGKAAEEVAAGARFVASSSGDILDTTAVTVSKGKLGYLLDNSSKSGVFSGSMGFDEASLDSSLRAHLTENFGGASRSEPMVGGGSKFNVRGLMTGPSGQTWGITTAWGVDANGTVRLITATP